MDCPGELIRQWGGCFGVSEGTNITFPIAFSTNIYAIAGNDMSVNGPDIQVISFADIGKEGFTLYGTRINLTDSIVWCRWIAVGK